MTDRERILFNWYTHGDREKGEERRSVARYERKVTNSGTEYAFEVYEVSGSQGAAVPEDWTCAELCTWPAQLFLAEVRSTRGTRLGHSSSGARPKRRSGSSSLFC